MFILSEMTIDKEIFLYVRFIVHSCSSDSDGFSDLHTSWNLCSIWQTLKNARSSVIYICFTKIHMNSIVLLFKSMATIQWLTADFTAKLLISNVKGSCTFWLFVFMLLFYLSLSDSFFLGSFYYAVSFPVLLHSGILFSTLQLFQVMNWKYSMKRKMIYVVSPYIIAF